MYKVIIVDDEKNIRQGIRDFIDWSELNCSVEGIFKNGKQAYEYIREKGRVDIIITDIKMPIMDGMELAELVNDEFPETKTVILTAYPDFELARQAIKRNISDYIVKSDFMDELPRAIKKIVRGFEKQYKNSLKEGQSCNAIANGSFFVALIEIPFQYDSTYPLLFSKMKAIIKKVAGATKTSFIENDEVSFYVVIGEKSDKKVFYILKRTSEIVLSFLKINIIIGVSGAEKDYDRIVSARDQAAIALSNILNYTKTVNMQTDICNSNFTKPEWDIEKYSRNLLLSIKEHNEEMFLSLISEYKSKIDCIEFSIDKCKENTYFILTYILKKSNKMYHEKVTLCSENLMKIIYLTKSKLFLKEVFVSICQTVKETVMNDNNTCNSNIVTLANEIITNNYDKKLSLKIISGRLFLNSSYLSRAYKLKTGKTITSAINEFRIKKAMELMEQNQYKMYEIGSMVGLDDPAYFTHTFIKYTGLNPSEYASKYNTENTTK